MPHTQLDPQRALDLLYRSIAKGKEVTKIEAWIMINRNIT
jgi:hypothetical protein